MSAVLEVLIRRGTPTVSGCFDSKLRGSPDGALPWNQSAIDSKSRCATLSRQEDATDMEEEWTFEHTIECAVSSEFAWDFWTNVRNWVLDADVDSVKIQGPFAAGAQGATQSKSSGRIEWRVAEVQPGRAVIEFPAPGVTARFLWTFEEAEGRTRITQRASISADQASPYLESIRRGLQAGIPAGMRKLCEAMQAAARMSAK